MFTLKMLKSRLKSGFFITGLLSLLFPFMVMASETSIVGKWKTISDVTHKVASVVRIWNYKGAYYGKVIKIYRQGGNKPTDRCVKCTGTYKNKPVLGMTFLFAMKEVSKGYYSDGKILDPKSGSVYGCNITAQGDDKLKVRGYIGFSLLGRTQYWYRS